MKKISIIVLIITLLPLNLLADGGSNYSIFGIGDVINSGSAAYSGLAGTSIAVPSTHAINPKNPALWGKVHISRLQAGYRFSQNSITSGSLTVNQNNGSVDNIIGLLSVDTSLGIGVSFGLQSYSAINYLSNTPVIINHEDLEMQGKTTYEGTGGLSQFYIGSSVRLIDELYIGAAGFATFGTVDAIVSTELYDYYSYETVSEREDYIIGYGYKLGLYYSLYGLSFGAFMEQFPSTNYNQDRTYYSYASGNELDTTITVEDIEINMPLNFGLGLSYQTGKFLFGTDLTMQDYSDFNYNTSPKAKFKNSMNLSFGISRLGNTQAGADMLDRITYNFGFGYKDLYYSVYNGDNSALTDIKDIYGSIGMAIPLSKKTNLDWSLQIGTRGTEDNGLIHEVYGKFLINLSIGEAGWFKPFKRSYK